MSRKILLWGLVLAMLSVVFGAFGAHALKNLVPSDKLTIFETGVRYQFMHAFALLALSLYVAQNGNTHLGNASIRWTSQFFLLGILFFSGSLYLLTFQTLCSYNYSKIIGPITPLGGLCFILGWAFWAAHVWRHKVDK